MSPENPRGRFVWHELMSTDPEAARPHWLGYVAVPDVDATVAGVNAAGGQLLFGPTDIPTVGRIAILTDPPGAAFAMHSSPGG